MSTTATIKVYTKEEIELFLQGDRREVDRLMLHGINGISAAFIAHATEEGKYFHALGSAEETSERMLWISAQIEKQKAKTEMMQKISEASVVWAIPLFLVFIGVSVWDRIVMILHHALGAKP